MSATDAAVEPALPWAIPNSVPNLPVGARIEVKWCLTIEAADANAVQGEAVPDDVGADDATTAADSNAEPTADAATERTVELESKAAAGVAADVAADHTDRTSAGQAAAETAENKQAKTEPEDGTEQTRDPELKPEAGVQAQAEQAGQEEDTAAPGVTERILWWGATVTEYKEVEGKNVAVLKYDAKEGFGEETRHVQFVSKGLLEDAEELMKWRLEGEESPESETEEDEEDEPGLDVGVVSVGQDGQEVHRGNLADAMNLCLARVVDRYQPRIESLTPFEQSFMLQGWSEFCQAVRQRAESKGPDGVLDEDDVREVSRELKRQRRW